MKILSTLAAIVALCCFAPAAHAQTVKSASMGDLVIKTMVVKVGGFNAPSSTTTVVVACDKDERNCKPIGSDIATTKGALAEVAPSAFLASGAVAAANNLRPAQTFVSSFSEGSKASGGNATANPSVMANATGTGGSSRADSNSSSFSDSSSVVKGSGNSLLDQSYTDRSRDSYVDRSNDTTIYIVPSDPNAGKG